MARGEGESGAPQRFLATVLFTDIVGSTERAVALGDRDWQELIRRHHAIVRGQLRRFGGREMDTAGDGFFAVFALPAQAIACARAAADEIKRSLDIEIRAGLHMGECEVNGDKVAGIAVHIGARVAHQAGASEVLVTGTLRELVQGSGIEFEDRGTAELKGVPGEWRLYAVRDASAVEPLPVDSERGRRALSQLPLPDQRARRPRRTRMQLLAAALALVVVASAASVFVLTRNSTSETIDAIDANSLGRIEAATGRLTGQVAVGARPAGVAFGAGSLWVANETDGTVSRVDPKTMHKEQTIQVGADPSALAYGHGAIWVTNSEDNTVSRINAEANEVVGDPILTGVAPSAVASGGEFVWVTDTASDSVTRIDPTTSETKSFAVLDRPSGVVFANGSVWVTNQASATVLRLDPAGHILQQIHVGNGPRAITAGGGSVWVANELDETVSRIDPSTNAITATVAVPPGPEGLAATNHAVWVSSRFGGLVSRIDFDAQSTHVGSRIPIRSSPHGIVAVGDGIWVAASGSPVGRHRGGTLRVTVSNDAYDSFDPATSYSFLPWSVLSMTNDGLVTFQRVAGAQGGTLVPDLAVSLPLPSDGGKTYTFQLRPDLKYSTGQPVLASDVRFGLERSFRLDLPRPDFYAGIVGGSACLQKPKTCDLSTGIVTDDRQRTVIFHLSEPDPEFLYKLALPFAWPLPQGTPMKVTNEGLAATGPYVITDNEKEKLVVLERNPSFREWSAAAQPDGYPDRIELTFDRSVAHETDGVLHGSYDLMLDSPPPDRLDQLRVESPSQLHPYALDATAYFFLNTKIAPFASPDARRALNFAIDRGSVGDPFGGQDSSPTCQVLPPNVAGYEPYCPYTSNPTTEGTWTGPDLDEARRLVRRSGTEGTHVTLWTATAFGGPQTRQMAATMRQLGYRTSIKKLPPKPYFAALSKFSNDIQMGLSGWVGDYPAPSVFLDGLLSCEAFLPDSPNNLNYGGFCDPKMDAAVHRAERLQLTNPAAAVRMWEQADRIATDAAPWVFLNNPRGIDFAGKNLGGYARHPVWGVLLDQLWVR